MPNTPQKHLFTRPFTVLLISQAAFGYAFSVYYLLPKFLTTEFDAGPIDIGFTTTAHAAAAVVALFISGFLVDRFGRKLFLSIGAAIMALSSFGLIFVVDIGVLFYAIRIIQGLAFAMSFTAGATLAVDLAPPSRVGQSIGLFGVTMLGMSAIAPMISEPLADLHGWEWTFASAGIAAALCTILTQFVSDPTQSESTTKLNDFRRILTYQGLTPIFVVITVVGAAFGAMLTFQAPFALELGMKAVRSFFVAYATVAVCVRIFFGTSIDRIGYRQVSIASLGLYAVTVCSMAMLQPGGLAIIGSFFGLAHGLFYPAFNAFAVAPLPVNERGKVMAFFQAWFSVGFAAGTLLLGYVAAATNYPTAFLCVGGATFLAWVLLITTIKGSPRSSNGKTAGTETLPVTHETTNNRVNF